MPLPGSPSAWGKSWILSFKNELVLIPVSSPVNCGAKQGWVTSTGTQECVPQYFRVKGGTSSRFLWGNAEPKGPSGSSFSPMQIPFWGAWEEDGGQAGIQCQAASLLGGGGRERCFPQVLWAFTRPLGSSQTHIY